MNMTYMNAVQPVFTLLKIREYLMIRIIILIIIFIPHTLNPLSSVVKLAVLIFLILRLAVD